MLYPEWLAEMGHLLLTLAVPLPLGWWMLHGLLHNLRHQKMPSCERQGRGSPDLAGHHFFPMFEKLL